MAAASAEMTSKPGTQMSYSVHRYDASQADLWSDFVRRSINGTFLLCRSYMDYHAHRFVDHSLVVRSGSRLVGVLPANEIDDGLVSHGGLTYGGLVFQARTSASEILEIFEAIGSYMQERSLRWMLYKAIPHIYHREPAEDDLYALFRQGARLERVELSSAIALSSRRGFSKSKRQGARKAIEAGLNVSETRDPRAFFAIVERRLREKYGRKPTHSVDEIELLMARHPESIRLFVATDAQGSSVAGALLYFCGPCIHVQYMASTDGGRDVGALDLVLGTILGSLDLHEYRWFDFGISTEEGGRLLNRGLLRQKEMFGGRAVVYPTFRWTPQPGRNSEGGSSVSTAN